MKRVSGSAGFTIIELVIAIVVLGYVLSAMTKMFMDLTVIGVQPEVRNIQALVAEDLMEEIRSKQYDEMLEKNANDNWSETLGIDSGETSGDTSTFDDVDDYAGLSESLTGTYAGYTRSVTVSYIDPSVDLTTPVTPPNPITTSGWTQELKLITITVSNVAAPNYVLRSLMGSARSRDDLY